MPKRDDVSKALAEIPMSLREWVEVMERTNRTELEAMAKSTQVAFQAVSEASRAAVAAFEAAGKANEKAAELTVQLAEIAGARVERFWLRLLPHTEPLLPLTPTEKETL